MYELHNLKIFKKKNLKFWDKSENVSRKKCLFWVSKVKKKRHLEIFWASKVENLQQKHRKF